MLTRSHQRSRADGGESRRRGRVGLRGWLTALTLAGAVLVATPAAAYSVLAHQDTVDSMWDAEIVPLLRQRFAGLTEAQLREAHAHAYGGALIQDLGYYPFGSHLFTNLTHYVRTGDFIASLIRGATDANEYAFALGALAHYASDNAGHPMAVNTAVPLMYPKVRTKVGTKALYIDSPARHVMVEFAYDVLRVAKGGYRTQAYRDRIGFEVSEAALERAVRDTYSLELKDLLLSVDLAIGTYRRAVGTTIPELTRIAWREKRREIEAATPGIGESEFVYAYSSLDYDREFGTKYRKPGLAARILAFCLKVVPKIGPFRPLSFEPLTREVEQLFLESANRARDRFRASLEAVARRSFALPNTDFDTGVTPVRGANRLADDTYAELLHELSKRRFAGVTAPLRQELNDFFSPPASRQNAATGEPEPRVRIELAALNGR
jgi:hypothetical protein